jgi:hypothetical protein
MVNGGANDRQAEGDVDAGDRAPALGCGVIAKAKQLGGYVPLVVVHRHHEIIEASAQLRKHGVGGQGALHGQASRDGLSDGRPDLVAILDAE